MKISIKQAYSRYLDFTKKDGNTIVAESVLLRDGTQVNIRPIRPDDAPRLQALFNRLSRQSIYYRFLGFRKVLPDQEAKRLAELDYQENMALVATKKQNGCEDIIGVARYAVGCPDWPDVADAAVVVEDQYQGRGLGTQLLKRLTSYAQAHGIRAFIATVHNDNNQIKRFIQQSGLPVERRAIERGISEIQVKLDAVPEG